jgi:hypothetical protein
MKKIYIALLLLINTLAYSQSVGTISGTILDIENNNTPLPFADAYIKGTSIGTTTDFDGNYLLKVEPGTYTLVFNFIGYKTIEVPNVVVKANENIVINKSLSASEGVSLNEIQITGTTNKESETALLTEQRKAVEITQSIGADELNRKGVGNAALAITKISGISKEGASNVYVRGLGDRYISTSYNGLTMPSNNINKKNIDLVLFTTDIIQNIAVNKAYAVNFYADFAAGNINVNSKEYTGNGFFEVALKTGVNTNAVGEDFVRNKSTGFFGFYGSYDHNPFATVISTGPDPINAQAPINSGISASGGKSFNVGKEGQFSFFLTGMFENEYTYLQGTEADYTNVLKKSFPNVDIYNYSTITTVMGNFIYKINNNHKVSYNSLFINNGNNEVGYYGVKGLGTNRDAMINSDAGFYQMNAQFNQNMIFVNQIMGTHKVNNDQLIFDWGLGYNNVNSNEPDRKRMSLEQYYLYLDNDPITSPSFYSNNSFDNQRYFEEIIDEEFNGRFNAKLTVSDNFVLNLGATDRYKTRDFENIRYGYKNIDPAFNINPKDFDAIFNVENWVNGLYETDVFRPIYPEGEGIFYIGPTNYPGLPENTYNAELTVFSGYASAELIFGEKWLIVPGIRTEWFNQAIDYNVINLIVNPGEIEVTENLVLPSLNVRYAINDKMNLRFSYSNTVSFPEFKEMAPYVYEGVTERIGGNPDILGHQPGVNYVNIPDISYSKVLNLDLKYEWFLSSDEIISLGAFAKQIKNPVNLVVANDATGTQRFFRTGDQANVYGLELEVRKNILNNNIGQNLLSTGFNVSYMYTEQDLYTTIQGVYSTSFNRSTEQLQGASPLLINADLNFKPNFGTKVFPTLNLVYSYFSDRIFALGSGQLGNKVEKGFSTLDFVWDNQIGEHFELNFRAKNLLNPDVEIVREINNNQVVVLESYKYGLNFGLQLKYNF